MTSRLTSLWTILVVPSFHKHVLDIWVVPDTGLDSEYYNEQVSSCSSKVYILVEKALVNILHMSGNSL